MSKKGSKNGDKQPKMQKKVPKTGTFLEKFKKKVPKTGTFLEKKFLCKKRFQKRGQYTKKHIKSVIMKL